MSKSTNSSFVNTSNIYVYENIPKNGGARRTYQSIIKYISRKYTIHILRGIKNTPFNIFDYMKLSLIDEYFHEKKLLKGIKEQYPIIIFQNWMTNSPYLLLLAKNRKLYILHEPLREYYDSKSWLNKTYKELLIDIIKIPILLLDRYLTINTDASIVSNSIYSQKQIKKAYKKESIVIYPGYDDEIFHKINSIRKENQIITVGSINKLKNQVFLVDVVKNIKKEIRPKLVMVGNGGSKEYIGRIIKYARHNKVTIEIKQNISDHDLNIEYNKSKLFIFNPLNEPFGIVVLEAMGVGLPVVANKIGGGYSELLETSPNNLINSSDPQIWATIIENLLRNPKSMQNIAKINTKIAQNHTGRIYAEHILEAMQNI